MTEPTDPQVAARRHPEPFQPGEMVRIPGMEWLFDPGRAYEIKDGPDANGVCRVWTDEGPARYEMVHDRFLHPCEPAARNWHKVGGDVITDVVAASEWPTNLTGGLAVTIDLPPYESGLP